VALFAGREVSAVAGVVVAAVTGSEQSTNVSTRRATYFRRSAGITLASICVTWTGEGVVVANDGSEVSADVVTCAFC